MNWIGTIIDNRYRVENICSSQGGMSELFFVKDLNNQFNGKIVLKICTQEDDEYIRRFRREIRLLNDFQGNSRVVQILDSNPDYVVGTPTPYFVMKYYEDGDLTKLIANLANNYEYQEDVFNRMILCIRELHINNTFHRDIKPQNFLIDGDNIVVSDFGLGAELNSSTQFTTTSMAWGTHGYMPPEYYLGGFKNCDAVSDIFMLGKSFYFLLTNRNPNYLSQDNISAPMYYFIERCCNQNRNNRYQSLAELQQDIKSVFDALLNRGGGVGKINQLLSSINSNLSQDTYISSEIIDFINTLSLLHNENKIKAIHELHDNIFGILTDQPIIDVLPEFMDSYAVMVEDGSYAWGYAETIARNMKIIFNHNQVSSEIKAKALELAIKSAYAMNRYAAMDTCVAMIVGIDNESLGLSIYPIIQNNAHTFIADIEPSNCRSDAVRQALMKIRHSVPSTA